jgi:hypothetical protein
MISGTYTILLTLLTTFWLGQTALFLLSYKASTRAKVAQPPLGGHL